ncbi:flavodoxin domain-containing protein [Aliidiomarina indica]|uniref:flavodoxin domain-containing protein n=1 Tax=Aliidiomarina indica TaxID=2749147 RepID=UPI00188EEB64|nr:flavodoxin domain-containing protein [Aliidiomarina indica]
MHFHILIGTTSGNTEYLADAVSQALISEGHTTTLHDQPDLTEVPTENALWLCCMATHGAGEYADSIYPFMQSLSDQRPALEGVRYALIGIGDSSYDTFCQAAQDADALFSGLGATRICDSLTIDMLNDLDPEANAVKWLDTWQSARSE